MRHGLADALFPTPRPAWWSDQGAVAWDKASDCAAGSCGHRWAALRQTPVSAFCAGPDPISELPERRVHNGILVTGRTMAIVRITFERLPDQHAKPRPLASQRCPHEPASLQSLSWCHGTPADIRLGTASLSTRKRVIEERTQNNLQASAAVTNAATFAGGPAYPCGASWRALPI
jgi:hypothetical protein